MMYKFSACGHPNILATHKTTLEFTKDSEVSKKGDCIVGVNADFDLKELKDFIQESKNKKSVIIEIENNEIKEAINAEINPGFSSSNELVIRKTGFLSERTFAVNADKAAFGLSRSLVSFLKDEKNKVSVAIYFT